MIENQKSLKLYVVLKSIFLVICWKYFPRTPTRIVLTWNFETELALTADVGNVSRLTVTRNSLRHSWRRLTSDGNIEWGTWEKQTKNQTSLKKKTFSSNKHP